ncbi:hypothetical protein MM213_06840 [Belliella sp. R4-6]|uniref:Secreted protein n=1 Tax=Belliella alkalica TaxID=1730871 RepID=A0ABS9V9U6_9BACT|nr:hypothetical protein [Belliella alkalica]MCH7413193.1 hypothetical protein [Belliella alkalica]
MKSLFHIFLCALLLMNGMVYSVIQGSYELNKSAIVERFCVNKSQPELKCDGKCYLAQQLKAEREKQEQNSKYSFSIDFGQFVATQVDANLPTPVVIEILQDYLKYNEAVTDFFVEAIEVPPRI